MSLRTQQGNQENKYGRTEEEIDCHISTLELILGMDTSIEKVMKVDADNVTNLNKMVVMAIP